MKLTRSQRLFVALGKLNERILRESDVLNADGPEHHVAQAFYLKQLRAFSKLLLSAALDAYKTKSLCYKLVPTSAASARVGA